MKKLLKIMFSRVFFVCLLLAVQLALLATFMYGLGESFIYVQVLLIGIRFFAVLKIINNKSNPAYKIAWMLPIIVSPMIGGIFYLVLGGNKPSRWKHKKVSRIEWQMRQYLAPPKDYAPLLSSIAADNMDAELQSRYIAASAFCPPYANTETEYLPIGEIKFQRLKEELRKAKHYIFLEYFIIEEGTMWNEVLEILQEKAKNGVDVRLIYDDFGCINKKLPRHYDQVLKKMGIKCCVFNPFRPVLSAVMNNRDHRKIAVIDGHTGITGGINLADEYININSPFGHWKDTSILLHGEGVWSLTVMFLSMWSYLTGTDENFNHYRPYLHQDGIIRAPGIVQPYSDGPWDDKAIGENVYLNMINRAKNYIYITTPYLILSNEIVSALQNAAQSGVDVRIITPHIPDKKYVFEVTRANYEPLIEKGVQIYEYTPGFIHAKTFVCDDEYATVGTINLDYRSLYLHFECGVWMYNTTAILDIKSDFIQTMKQSQHISLNFCRNTPWWRRMIRSILNAFSPLM
ncbi:MAG: cardiolipin synthase [Oscillospiraceae bacterium]|nr:cardiolipin synthase [Oscillospiraceae bacterium]